MVLLCFGSYFAGIRRNRAKSGKIGSSGNHDEGSIRPDEGRIDWFRQAQKRPKTGPSLQSDGLFKGDLCQIRGRGDFPPNSKHLDQIRRGEIRSKGASLEEKWRDQEKLRDQDQDSLQSTPISIADHDLLSLYLFYSLFCHV